MATQPRPSMTQMAISLVSLRPSLYANGYRPVAIKYGEKFPLDLEWGDRARRDPPAVITEPFNVNYPWTGILCDGLRAIDIDLSDEAAVDAIANWCHDNLGQAPLRFRRNTSRILLLYRAEKGEPTKSKQWNRDTKEGVEVLGHGQQFLAYGFHPSGGEIEWLDDVGPHNVPRDQLVSITEDQVMALLEFVKPFIGEATVLTRRSIEDSPSFQAFATSDVDVEDVAAALAVIPNINTDYDTWLKIGMGVFTSTKGSAEGYGLWEKWSAQNVRSKRDECLAPWKAWHRSNPKVMFGTLMFYARQADPTFITKQTKDNILNLFEKKRQQREATMTAAKTLLLQERLQRLSKFNPAL